METPSSVSAQQSDYISETKEDIEEPSKASVSLFKFDDRDSPFKQKSEVDVNSLLGSEEYYSSDSKREIEHFYPFGEQYIPLTSSIINDKKNKLGVIKLHWPTLDTKLPDSAKTFPETYIKNSNKEKVLLLYAENFRKQYHANFPTKKPLLLAAENECGIQKMVSTTIRPTKLCYPELHTWQGCAAFVSDHVVYKPLNSPHIMVSTDLLPTYHLTVSLKMVFFIPW
ncbi:dynein regulatory complex subunit 7-like [Homalodisca vitripennis]|nr:dynein regulatory complex subunit 7-like [Homalodisca vitripennis]